MKNFYFIPRPLGPWQDSAGNRFSIHEKGGKTKTNAPVVESADEWSAAVLFNFNAVETAALTRVITKLTLKRRLEALDKWEAFKGLLAASSESVRDEWDLANDLSSSDPMFGEYAPQFKAALGLTDQQFDGLFDSVPLPP